MAGRPAWTARSIRRGSPSPDPWEADYVYTQPGIEHAGERLGSGTAANLVLWQTGGTVRVVGASSNSDLRIADCS